MTKKSIFKILLLWLLFITGVVKYLPPPSTSNDIFLTYSIEKIRNTNNFTNKYAFLEKYLLLVISKLKIY